MAYFANQHDVYLQQTAIIEHQAQCIVRLEQLLNTGMFSHRTPASTLQQSTQTDARPTDKMVHRSVQTIANNTNSAVVTGARKRVALEDAREVSLRKRRAKERAAFTSVAALFGGQEKSGITSVEVHVQYDSGRDNRFVAWGKPSGANNTAENTTEETDITGRSKHVSSRSDRQ